jgi:glycolate oxidase iron-sulfur subunit
MKLLAEGEVEMTGAVVRHFDRCLGCLACVPACPSGVQYGKLIEATRAQVERTHRRGLGERLFRWTLFALFPHPGRLRVLAVLLWGYQATGLRWLLNRSGALRLLPRRLRAVEELQPRVSLGALRTRVPETTPVVGEQRQRAGLLLGCVQRAFFAEVNAATARVLAAEGFEVVAPRSQGCCGALLVHAGREGEAAEYARRLIDAFEAAGVDLIAIAAAGCGSTMKEYGRLLRDDPAYSQRARIFSAKCRDVSEVLASQTPRAPRKPVEMRVAWHNPCHLQHAQGIASQPRDVLRTIPGLEVVEVPEAEMCCGSAGIYNLVEPEAARDLGARKAANILSTGAAAVVTSNPGCALQIEQALRRAGSDMPVLHIVELVGLSFRNAGCGMRNAE